MKELIEIQTKLNAPKGQYNSFGKYKYRSCEDILGAVKPLLHEHRCTLTISDDVVMVGSRIYIKSTATLTNSSNEQVVTNAFAREEEQKKGMDGSQVTGAASSYARKYALNGLFAIDDTKDADHLNGNPQLQQGQSTAHSDDNYPTTDELLKQYAFPAIKQARSGKELAQIYNSYKELQDMSEFTSALTARRKALGIKKSNEK